jgi:hypothetical protein
MHCLPTRRNQLENDPHTTSNDVQGILVPPQSKSTILLKKRIRKYCSASRPPPTHITLPYTFLHCISDALSHKTVTKT